MLLDLLESRVRVILFVGCRLLADSPFGIEHTGAALHPNRVLAAQQKFKPRIAKECVLAPRRDISD